MCFHFSITQQMSTLEQLLNVEWQGQEWQPVYHANGFSFLALPVITAAAPQQLQLMNWGLIPSWIKSKEEADKIKTQTLNARSETAFEKPSFRGSMLRQRCLIPADGFYEWMHLNGKKYPHYIRFRNQEPFCMGGIYAQWVDRSTGEILSGFSILTTTANPLLEKIHNLKKRMPVIIPANQTENWLNVDLSRDAIEAFFKPYPAVEMEAFPVSKLISSRSDNSNVPEVRQPFIYEALG